MALNSRSEGSHCTYVTIQNVVDNLDKALKNKIPFCLQDTCLLYPRTNDFDRRSVHYTRLAHSLLKWLHFLQTAAHTD